MPSGQQGPPGTRMLGDKEPRTQPRIPRLCCARNGQGGPLAPLPYRNPRPRKKVFIPVLPGARQEGMHGGALPGAPEMEDILASIFNETARTAGQGPQTD